MTYEGKYIDPIFDRTLADIEYAKEHPTEMSKGAYNYIDLNRIENNTRYVADDMYNRGITPEPINMNSKYNWNEREIPTIEDMNRIINNILLLQALSAEGLELNTIYAGGQMTYLMANAIEKNLEIMRTQPLPEPDKFYLEVENGTGSGHYIEDTVVTISANMPPENKIFDRWSGSADDLKQVGNVYASTTTFTMWHKDAKVTANYKSGLAHSLKIDPTGIAGDGTYYEGDVVTIIAADAPNGMVFHHWEGEYVDNLVNQQASTTLFTMPDADVVLKAIYIYPGKHYVTVSGGSGSGWYEYDDYVFISATLPGSKYTFSHWSGDVSKLASTTSSSASFRMGDKALKFTAHFTYHPGTCELTVVNGTGSGSYTEGKSVAISANAAPEGKGFYNWTKSGVGSISNADSSSTTYTAGDGKATVTANYRPTHELTVENTNNNGGITSYVMVEGKKRTVSTTKYLSDYTFDHWEENSSSISTSTSITITMGTEDRTIKAIYRARESYTLTVNNGSGSGTYLEGTTVTVTADTAPEGQQFDYWSFSNIESYTYKYSTPTRVTIGRKNCTVTAVYKAIPGPKVYHTLTVNSGSGSGSYYEGQSIRIVANSAPSGYRFKEWTGDISGISSATSSSTYITMGTSDKTVTATYELLPDRTLTVNRGTGSGTYKNGTTIKIIADEAPDDMTFLTWVGDVSQVEDVWASTSRVVGISANTTVTATYFTPEHPEEYRLTIINGSFSADYPAGSEVAITADAPLEGYEFWKWTGDIATIRDTRAAETTMVMPAAPTTITANYRKEGSIDLYTLTVNYGEGSGDYEELTEVPVKANPPSNGYEFDKWLGDTANIMNVEASETVFVIGRNDAVITASYKALQKYTLTVNGGYGSGSYWKGKEVELIANKVDNDDVHYDFIEWTGDVETVEDTSAETTKMYMLERDCEITANYNEYWHLIVANGSKSDYYLAGSTITIQADTAPEGMKFSKWIGDTSVLSSIYNENPKVSMPNSVVHLTAVYTTIGQDNSVAKYDGVLVDNETVITSNKLTVISDTLEVGTLVTDNNGNVGVITEQTDDEYKVILKMTVSKEGE